MSPETLAAIARLAPRKYVWCQHGQQPGLKMDEHQVCIDQEAAHRARGGTSWGCTCKCHR
jgi:hypothetical protein